jgi:hypothetical protein
VLASHFTFCLEIVALVVVFINCIKQKAVSYSGIMSHQEKRPTKKGSPSSKRQRTAENLQWNFNIPAAPGTAAVEVSTSSTSSSSLSTSSASKLAGPVSLNEALLSRQVAGEGGGGTSGNVLEQLLGRVPQQLAQHQQPSFAPHYASQRDQLAGMLSGQILMQRQRQLQLEQLQSRDTMTYNLMLQQQQMQRSNAAASCNSYLGGNSLSLGAIQASLGAGSSLGYGSLTGSVNLDSLRNMMPSQEFQRQGMQNLAQNQFFVQQLEQQLRHGRQAQLPSQFGVAATDTGKRGHVEVATMVDALLLEQKILAARRSSAIPSGMDSRAGNPMSPLLANQGVYQQQAMSHPLTMLQNQVSATNPLLSLPEVSTRQSRQGQDDTDLALAMPTSYERASLMNLSTNLQGHDKIIPMSIPSDDDTLSEYQCLVREQIIFFAASAEEVGGSVQGRNRPIVLGQVGIHCIHCWYEQHSKKARFIRQKPRGASYFPSKLSGIYQAAQNMVTNHFMDGCRSLPADVKALLIAPRMIDYGHASPAFHPTSAIKRGWATSSAGGGKKYWASAAQKLGIVETEENGLKFREDVVTGSGAPDVGDDVNVEVKDASTNQVRVDESL